MGMKRLLLIALPLAFVIAGYLFIKWDPNAPKFVPIPSFKVPAYSGREIGQQSDGVFLRDMLTKKEITLVEPENARYFAIPNFYGTNVIYIRSNQLWRIDFNGSNNVRLFPPPA